MGTNQRTPEMLARFERAARARDDEAIADAQKTVDVFNSRLAARKAAWFWPTIGAALATKHYWLIIACDSCDTILDVDLTVKRRDPVAPIHFALNGLSCPRCDGSGHPRIIKLARFPNSD